MKRLSSLERMLMLSVLFSMALLLVRFCYTRELTYCFYAWNTFLAVVPVLFSRALKQWGLKAFLLLAGWLAFFPNAPYLVTDLFHYSDKPPVPQWYDLVLVCSAAWNGLLLGVISLMQVERFLSAHLRGLWVKTFVLFSFFLCAYGVYIGRYLRLNSWEIVTDPGKIIGSLSAHLFHPGLWAFTLVFGAMFGIIYLTLQQIHEKAN
jgi:uncharacterized membrane protein